MSKLAIHGGQPAVPSGMIKPWPPVDDVDREMVMASLNQDRHTFGPNCVEFEKEFAQWNGNKSAITTNSGTAALHMAVAACGCGAGDQVIVPSYSWSSSATCVIHHNAIPVFVDMDWDTMNMDPAKIEEAITPHTKAIIAVHLHGLPVDMRRVMEIAERHKIKVIEDACQAHGATVQGKKVGQWGDCAAFSLNQNKCLCSGEGGMFTTDDEELLQKARMVWSFGETRTPVEDRDYHAYALGWMYRNNDLTAAFGRAQLTKLDGYLETQRRHGRMLLDLLKNVKGLILPVEPEGLSSNFYNFTSRIDMEAVGWTDEPARLRDAVMKALQAEGVQVGVWQRFILPSMTVFTAKNAYGKGCPWSCRDAGNVDYNPEDYPVAQKHSVSHFGMTTPIREPNGDDVTKAVAEGFQKVFENIDQIDPAKVLEKT